MLWSNRYQSRLSPTIGTRFDGNWARAIRLVGCVVIVGGLGGCFQPMYGSVGGKDLARELASIVVNPVPDRIGYYLTNELTFAFVGGGAPSAQKYRLNVVLRERIQTPLVDTISGRATSATISVDADYRLVESISSTVVASGTAFVTESYDRSSQRFANIRAARDAEIRSAKSLADQIRTRIAMAISTQG